MHFPDDFKKKLKEILPMEYNEAIDNGDFSAIHSRLHGISNDPIYAEEIVSAFKEGRAQEDILGRAKKILKAKDLLKELMLLWQNKSKKF